MFWGITTAKINRFKKKSVSFGNFIEFAIKCRKSHHSRSSHLEMTNKRKSSPSNQKWRKNFHLDFRRCLRRVVKDKRTIFYLEYFFMTSSGHSINKKETWHSINKKETHKKLILSKKWCICVWRRGTTKI